MCRRCRLCRRCRVCRRCRACRRCRLCRLCRRCTLAAHPAPRQHRLLEEPPLARLCPFSARRSPSELRPSPGCRSTALPGANGRVARCRRQRSSFLLPGPAPAPLCPPGLAAAGSRKLCGRICAARRAGAPRRRAVLVETLGVGVPADRGGPQAPRSAGQRGGNPGTRGPAGRRPTSARRIRRPDAPGALCGQATARPRDPLGSGRFGRFRERPEVPAPAPPPAPRAASGGSAVRAFPRPLGSFRQPSGALRSFPRPLGSFRGGRRRARPFPPLAARSAVSVSARRFPCGPRRARRLLPGWRSSVGRCLPVAGLGAPVCV